MIPTDTRKDNMEDESDVSIRQTGLDLQYFLSSTRRIFQEFWMKLLYSLWDLEEDLD